MVVRCSILKRVQWKGQNIDILLNISCSSVCPQKYLLKQPEAASFLWYHVPNNTVPCHTIFGFFSSSSRSRRRPFPIVFTIPCPCSGIRGTCTVDKGKKASSSSCIHRESELSRESAIRRDCAVELKEGEEEGARDEAHPEEIREL